MKKYITRIMKNKYFKVGIGVILLIGIIFEGYPMYVDMYNFRQLEKAKPILESIPEDAYKFNTLKDFNERYDANIQPIKNCYYIGNSNGEEKYLFGFQLESRYFKKKYNTEYYAYPKYDRKVSPTCVMGGGCIDGSMQFFIRTITTPCKD